MRVSSMATGEPLEMTVVDWFGTNEAGWYPLVYAVTCQGCGHVYASLSEARVRQKFAAHFRRQGHKLFSDHVHWLYDARRKLCEADEDLLVERLLDPAYAPPADENGIVTYPIADDTPFDQLPRGCHRE